MYKNKIFDMILEKFNKIYIEGNVKINIYIFLAMIYFVEIGYDFFYNITLRKIQEKSVKLISVFSVFEEKQKLINLIYFGSILFWNEK